MSDISIQFHATPEETAQFIGDMLSNLDLHVVGMSSQPFQAVELVGRQVEEAVRSGSFWRLAFTEADPRLPVASQKEFGEKNPGALYLDVGKLTARGLSESWLACRTNNAPLPPAWKKFQSKLRSVTQCGAVARHPDGATAIIRNHRFTSGAKALSDEGTPILPIAGITTLKLGIDT